MKYVVRIHKKGRIKELEAEKGTDLLRFLRKHTDIAAPCGGKGTCGKCRVKADGILHEPGNKEKKLLGSEWLEKGYRLACYNEINSDMDIYLDKHGEKASIVTQAKERKTKLDPLVVKEYLELEIPDILDQRTDAERVKAAAKYKAGAGLELVRQLPDTLRQSGYKLTFVYIDEKLVSVEPGNTVSTNCGIAVDIGTTTIAAYMVDLNTGKKLGIYSVLNPQKKFGSDVISRINHTVENENGLEELHESIIECINGIIDYFIKTLKISKNDIYSVTFAGNTTMLHLLMKLPCANIAKAPFIPATTEFYKLKAEELKLNINSCGYAFILPSLSAYIGADTIAAVLSSGMYSDERTTLLIDLGTNGEIVLGNSKWMYSCSTAAGPAFEGANIRNGLGGVEGAIDKVVFKPEFAVNTIGGKKALGICGSGLIDAVAGMLSEGIIDQTGRIISSEDAANLDKSLWERLIKVDGQNSFEICKKRGRTGPDISLTQKDIRELQNAKAAVSAGIKILIMQAGINVTDIDRVLLAGGFGYHIDTASALKIGLLPKELDGKIEVIGNAAGAGAVECLISSKRLKKALQIKGRIKYIELSLKSEFMDEYVESMLFDVPL